MVKSTYLKTAVGAIIIVCLCFSYAIAYSGGTGEPNNPYQIANAGDWLLLMNTPTDCNKCFLMTADVNLQGINLTSVGTSSHMFTGVFDGSYHIIRNPTLDTESLTSCNPGLFGCIDSKGVVKKLGIENYSVLIFSSADNLGALAGQNHGTILNCYTTGEIIAGMNNATSHKIGGFAGMNDGNLINCWTESYIFYHNYISTQVLEIGGLVGRNEGNLKNCYTTGFVMGRDYTGGLAGTNYGGITDCYSTTTVNNALNHFGGLIGGGYGNVYSSFWDVNTSEIPPDTNPYHGIGITTDQMQDVNTLLNAGWDFVNETANGSEDIWQMRSDITDYPKFHWQFPKGDLNADMLVNMDDFSILAGSWQLAEGQTGYNKICDISEDNVIDIKDLSFLLTNWLKGSGSAYSGGKGTESNPYLISTKQDLLNLRSNKCDYKKYFVLTNDIDLSDDSFYGALIAGDMFNNYPFNDDQSFQGIKFQGVFDGNGHKISGLTINNCENCFIGDYLGLFGYVGRNGVIKNLCVENCSISSKNPSASYYVGGLIAFDDCGTVMNCYSTGSVYSIGGYIGGLVGMSFGGKMYNCFSTASVSGTEGAGGFIGGFSCSIIENCYSSIGPVYGSSISDIFSELDNTPSYTGGFVGYISSDRSKSNWIKNCYSTNPVSGVGYLGGFAGYGGNDPHLVIACFWDVNTSGQNWSAGGEGLTTAQMQTLSTFANAGWDFSYSDGDEADWFMPIDDYPILTRQISPADIYTDGKNNFMDFATFAQYWMRKDCRIYNDYCDWADLNFDGKVDYEDLFELMSYWLAEGIYQ